MGEIDETSLKIGSVESDIKSIFRLHHAMDNKIDRLLDQMVTVSNKADSAHSRLDAIERDVVTKRDALRVILGFGAVGGVGGVGVMKAIAAIFGVSQ